MNCCNQLIAVSTLAVAAGEFHGRPVYRIGHFSPTGGSPIFQNFLKIIRVKFVLGLVSLGGAWSPCPLYTGLFHDNSLTSQAPPCEARSLQFAQSAKSLIGTGEWSPKIACPGLYTLAQLDSSAPYRGRGTWWRECSCRACRRCC